VQYPATTADQREPFDVGRLTVDLLLLELFNFYVRDRYMCIMAWHTLVHVCQRWRNVVLGSPNRLNLQLHCTRMKPVWQMLDLWPPLPIYYVDNIIVALEHHDRVRREIELSMVANSPLETILAAVQVQFPALTHLDLLSEHETVPAVVDSFLGGSAPVCDISTWTRSISGIFKATFICHRPSLFLTPYYSSFRVQITGGNGHLPLFVDKTQKTCP